MQRQTNWCNPCNNKHKTSIPPWFYHPKFQSCNYLTHPIQTYYPHFQLCNAFTPTHSNINLLHNKHNKHSPHTCYHQPPPKLNTKIIAFIANNSIILILKHPMKIKLNQDAATAREQTWVSVPRVFAPLPIQMAVPPFQPLHVHDVDVIISNHLHTLHTKTLGAHDTIMLSPPSYCCTMMLSCSHPSWCHCPILQSIQCYHPTIPTPKP